MAMRYARYAPDMSRLPHDMALKMRTRACPDDLPRRRPGKTAAHPYRAAQHVRRCLC